MLGAILGDMIGSPYEHVDLKGYDLPLWSRLSRFSDDTVIMAATADAILSQRDFESVTRAWCSDYPDAGYGDGIKSWMKGIDSEDGYHSKGNSAAIRGLVIGMLAASEESIPPLIKKAIKFSHDHEESYLYANAVALAAFRLKFGHGRIDTLEFIQESLKVELDFCLDELHEFYEFSTECAKSVPEAIFVALTAESYSDAMRKCLYIGGDTDSIMSIVGGLLSMSNDTKESIPEELRQNCGNQLKINAPEIYEILSKVEIAIANTVA